VKYKFLSDGTIQERNNVPLGLRAAELAILERVEALCVGQLLYEERLTLVASAMVRIEDALVRLEKGTKKKVGGKA